MKIRALCLLALTIACSADPLPGTQTLKEEGDLAAKMVQGIHRFLDRETVEVTKARAALWKPDTSSPEAWEKYMEPKRARLRQLLGMVDERGTPDARAFISRRRVLLPDQDGTAPAPAPPPSSPARPSYAEWNVLRGLRSEGVLSYNNTFNPGYVIIIPDAGVSPEQAFGTVEGQPLERQWGNWLAGTHALKVLALTMLDRRTGAQLPEGRRSRLSQRELLWRASFEMGRSMLGYEVQKVLAAVDNIRAQDGGAQIGLIGSGEGGLVALLAAAADTRIASVGVEGAFAPMDRQWEQPIDRTVFGLLREFGAAEIASMIAPRQLVMRNTDWPRTILTDEGGGAPGRLVEPAAAEIEAEVDKLRETTRLVSRPAYSPYVVNEPKAFLERVTMALGSGSHALSVPAGKHYSAPGNESARQARLFNNLLEDTQHLMRQAQKARGEYWKGADFSSAEKFAESAKAYREKFWNDITGKLPPATLPPNARSRQIYDTEKFTGWEIMLDVYPDVFSFGTLLLPKDMKAGEKRAVVVCQHGLEGRPSDLADPKLDHPAYHTYGARLAEKGYIVFAPQNPYIGKTEFRQICRKAWPLGLSLWSFIVRQHEVILTWLKTQPNVDAARIAFYGLSYGGKTAMRIPALLPDYCLSICSADYNEWIWKNVDASAPYSYLHTNEYDMVEWNMGNTFNYAELSWLIFPRPFMVERGHDDGVSCDEWVAYEFARTRRHYSKLGLGDRTEIEFFNGPHTINGQGTFRFLDKWLAK